MYETYEEFLYHLTGHDWQYISARELKLRKTAKAPAAVVTVLAPNEKLLGHSVPYYLPFGATLHGLPRIFWEEYLEKGVLKYGARVLPALRINLETVPKISLERLIYPYLIKGELGLTGDMTLAHIHRANQTTLDVSTFRVKAGMMLGDVMSSFGITSYDPSVGMSISNTILQDKFNSSQIQVSADMNMPGSFKIQVTLNTNATTTRKQIGIWEIEYQLGYEFKGTATLIPPKPNAQNQTQENAAPLLSAQEVQELGAGIAAVAIFIFRLASTIIPAA